jgi:hypothetical protein
MDEGYFGKLEWDCVVMRAVLCCGGCGYVAIGKGIAGKFLYL